MGVRADWIIHSLGVTLYELLTGTPPFYTGDVSSGVKYEKRLSDPAGTAMSFGLDFSSPVSRPPIVLTDGYRHTDPFISFSRPLVPKIRLVGFLTFGADF